MNNDFIKVAAATPEIKVCDTDYNCSKIIKIINDCNELGVSVVIFPELCITGYTCSDLFLQSTLLDNAFDCVEKIACYTSQLEMLVVVGAPIRIENKLYNCAVVICHGEILGIVPKANIPNYSEFYEMRHFTPADDIVREVTIRNNQYLFGKNMIFCDTVNEKFKLGIEICEDLWVTNPCSNGLVGSGATVIGNLSASNETIAKADYRRNLVISQSGSALCGYIYASAGEGESTTDLIFSGHNIICENGSVLNESKLFENSVIVSEIDLGKINFERCRLNTFRCHNDGYYREVWFTIEKKEIDLTRFVDAHPFVPSSPEKKALRCEQIFAMQSLGLKKRLLHTDSKSLVIGISGGLDSTLAILVAVKAIDMLGRSRKDIIAVTMPCFGTTARTKNNAEVLCECLGVTLKIIDIKKSVDLHFEDIGHNKESHDVVYENAQARERTQILMDIANMENGLVIGTGDLSELALGWATYNGDHMSMYAVNSSVPKTLVRHIVKFYADTTEDEKLKMALNDIVDTPVSPELLPPQDGLISQVTEDIVGPYELHDFFLYNFVRYGFSPKKIYFLAWYAFKGEYDNATILNWLKVFVKRFFAQQFKRSCLPDGPKVGTVTLSPRGDWRMPSDAVSKIWLDEIDRLK